MRKQIEQIIITRDKNGNEISTKTNKIDISKLSKKYPYENLDDNMNDEKWQFDPTRKRNKFWVSNKGRIKNFEGKILEQIDSPDYGKGWLVLKDYPTVLVYKLVAEAWLKYPEEGSGWHIHHIDNDGYNNCPENLIYVSSEEHNKIHH